MSIFFRRKRKVVLTCYLWNIDWVLPCVEFTEAQTVADLKVHIKAKAYPNLERYGAPELILHKPRTDISINNIASLHARVASFFPNGYPSDTLLEEVHEGTTNLFERVHLISNPEFINLFVSVPGHVKRVDPDPLFSLVIPRAPQLPHERIANRLFKQALYRYYVNPGAETYPNRLTCSLTGVELPADSIIAAHIWSRSLGATQEWFGFPDIDDPRNGLLLCKVVKHAFDYSGLAFYQDADRHLRCRIMDQHLKNMEFKTYITKYIIKDGDRKKGETAKLYQTVPILEEAGFFVFADLEKPTVYLRFPQPREPFKRVLNLRLIQAHQAAVKRHETFAEDYDFEDFYSDDTDHNAGLSIDAWEKVVASARIE